MEDNLSFSVMLRLRLHQSGIFIKGKIVPLVIYIFFKYEGGGGIQCSIVIFRETHELTTIWFYMNDKRQRP